MDVENVKIELTEKIQNFLRTSSLIRKIHRNKNPKAGPIKLKFIKSINVSHPLCRDLLSKFQIILFIY